MKNFLHYLAVGLLIAVVASGGICYLVWSLQTMHRIIWLVIVGIIGLFVYAYLNSGYATSAWCYNEKGDLTLRKMTKSEQVGMVAKYLIGTVILGVLIWTIGYGVACQFEWNPPYWEVYLLYGVGTIAAVFGTIGIFALTFYLVKYFDWNSPRVQAAITLGKNALMWIVVITCSLAVAGAIFYFFLPLALK